MTCIVAIENQGQTILIGDSAGCNDDGLIELRKDPKVFRRGEYLIGYTTSFRMGQLLHYNAEFPEPPEEANLGPFMIREFVPAVRQAFADGGFIKTLHRGETSPLNHWSERGQEWAGQFVIGVRGQLFVMGSDFQIGIPQLPYIAIGSGAKVAYGTLFATSHLGLEERAELALEAAAQHCTCVRPPFVTVRR